MGMVIFFYSDLDIHRVFNYIANLVLPQMKPAEENFNPRDLAAGFYSSYVKVTSNESNPLGA